MKVTNFVGGSNNIVSIILLFSKTFLIISPHLKPKTKRWFLVLSLTPAPIYIVITNYKRKGRVIILMLE